MVLSLSLSSGNEMFSPNDFTSGLSSNKSLISVLTEYGLSLMISLIKSLLEVFTQ